MTEEPTQIVLIARPGDRRVGVVRHDGEQVLALPMGGSVWTRHATIDDAFAHCLAFVGWADLG